MSIKITIPFSALPAPVLMPIVDGKWRLIKAYRTGCDYCGEQIRISIPIGYETDLDSVPRITLFYEIFKGRTRTAALIHDWLYKNEFDRKKSDHLFLGFMAAEGVKKRYSLPIFYAVRLFGWIWY